LLDKIKLKKLLKENQFSTIVKNLQGLDLTTIDDNIFFLQTLTQKLLNQVSVKKINVALIGASTLYPLSEYLKVFSLIREDLIDLHVGEYNNYKQELLDESSFLYNQSFDFIIVQPDDVISSLNVPYCAKVDTIKKLVFDHVEREISLLKRYHLETGSEVFILGSASVCSGDIGPYVRNSSGGSGWVLSRLYNSCLREMGDGWCNICDLEFLSARLGLKNVYDSKFSIETKNLYSNEFLIALASELSHLIQMRTKTMKKVLVCDLDNTLWGGVIGDDGVEGIELDDVGFRGIAFKNFQRSIKRLMGIGVVLAIASKNEESVAKDAFENHPDMVLKWDDFVSHKVNWSPKSDNIKEISEELNLGLSSFVFIDDNPAEIDIVNQFLPEVSTILLNSDPSGFVDKLYDSRFFEPKAITDEDLDKTEQYRVEASRHKIRSSFTNLEEYLSSLQMTGGFKCFEPIYFSRVSQLTQKSNQFNLTTVRRSEPEVRALVSNPDYFCFSTHVKDRFGDYGLIGVNVLELKAGCIIIETWLMSCRVLKRQVECEVLNFIVNYAKKHDIKKIIGVYKPTKKNIIVADHYKNLGFALFEVDDEKNIIYHLDVSSYIKKKTSININIGENSE
jgi:FkbH-like protein